MTGFLCFEGEDVTTTDSILTKEEAAGDSVLSKWDTSSRSVKGDEVERFRKGEGGDSSLIRLFGELMESEGRTLDLVDVRAVSKVRGFTSAFVDPSSEAKSSGDSKYFEVVSPSSSISRLAARLLLRNIVGVFCAVMDARSDRSMCLSKSGYCKQSTSEYSIEDRETSTLSGSPIDPCGQRTGCLRARRLAHCFRNVFYFRYYQNKSHSNFGPRPFSLPLSSILSITGLDLDA